MEPVPQTTRVLRALARTSPTDLEAHLRAFTDRLGAAVRSCVAVSFTLTREDLTLTFIAPPDVAAALGAHHRAPDPRAGTPGAVGDVLDEGRWQREALHGAADHVRSTLTVPVLLHGTVSADLVLYSADPHAFTGRSPELRALTGTHQGVVNADLPFRSHDNARRALDVLADHDVVERAVGYLMATRHLDADQARHQLTTTACDTRTDLPTTARTLLRMRP